LGFALVSLTRQRRGGHDRSLARSAGRALPTGRRSRSARAPWRRFAAGPGHGLVPGRWLSPGRPVDRGMFTRRGTARAGALFGHAPAVWVLPGGTLRLLPSGAGWRLSRTLWVLRPVRPVGASIPRYRRALRRPRPGSGLGGPAFRGTRSTRRPLVTCRPLRCGRVSFRTASTGPAPVAGIFLRPGVVSLVVHSRPSQIGACWHAVPRTEPTRTVAAGVATSVQSVSRVTAPPSSGTAGAETRFRERTILRGVPNRTLAHLDYVHGELTEQVGHAIQFFRSPGRTRRVLQLVAVHPAHVGQHVPTAHGAR